MTEQEHVDLLYEQRKEIRRNFTEDYLSGNIYKLEADINYVISVLQYYHEGHESKDFELGMLLGEAYAYKKLLYEQDQAHRAELRERDRKKMGRSKQMTPKEFAERLKEIDKEADVEEFHIEADKIMCELLESFGYGEGVKYFKDHELWYS